MYDTCCEREREFVTSTEKVNVTESVSENVLLNVLDSVGEVVNVAVMSCDAVDVKVKLSVELRVIVAVSDTSWEKDSEKVPVGESVKLGVGVKDVV